MASYTVAEAKHATFSTTVADLITFDTAWQVVRVVNKDSTNNVYFAVNTATVPTAAAVDTHLVRAGEAVVFASKSPVKLVRLVGSGYSVEGFPGFGSSASSSGGSSGGGAVTNAGTFVTQENGALLTSAQLIDDAVFVDDAAFTPATSKGFAVGMEADETATDSVDEGDFGVPRITLDRKQVVTQRGHASGGLTIIDNIDVDESQDAVKASAGQIYTLYAYNNAASTRYLRFYNVASASVTVGTTATFLGPFGIPAGGGFVLNTDIGFAFDTAIAIAATTGVAANDTGAPGANDVVVVIGYV